MQADVLPVFSSVAWLHVAPGMYLPFTTTSVTFTLALLVSEACASNFSTYIGTRNSLCQYSGEWLFSVIPNAFGNTVSSSARLGDSLQVTLPENTSSVTYIGLQDKIPALFSACLDCDNTDQAEAKQARITYKGTNQSSITTAPFFSFRDMDPTTPHVLTVTNLWDPSSGVQSRTSFAGLVVTIANGSSNATPPLSATIPAVTISPPGSGALSSASIFMPQSSVTLSSVIRPSSFSTSPVESDWAAPSSTSGPPSSTSPSASLSAGDPLAPGVLPNTTNADSQPFGPTVGPESAASGSTSHGLSTGLIALIGVLSGVGGFAVAAVAGFLVWHRRRTTAATRGMMPLTDESRGGSATFIEPFFLSTAGPSTNTAYNSRQQPGRPSSPNFFSARPFGGSGSRQGTQSISPHAHLVPSMMEQSQSNHDTEQPRQPSSPASPWLARTPRNSFAGVAL